MPPRLDAWPEHRLSSAERDHVRKCEVLCLQVANMAEEMGLGRVECCWFYPRGRAPIDTGWDCYAFRFKDKEREVYRIYVGGPSLLHNCNEYDIKRAGLCTPLDRDRLEKLTNAVLLLA